MKLRIEKCIYGGAGLARVEGKAVFVPLSLPGELLEARSVEERPGYIQAEVETILEASHQRSQPPCEYYGLCGGCHYQHADYALQLEIKRSILSETLERAHLRGLPEIQPVFAAPWAYRNRVRLHIAEQPFGLCYRKRSSHQGLAVHQCPISAPMLEQAIAAVQRVGQSCGIGNFQEIEFFTNHAQDELLLSLWTDRHLPRVGAVLGHFCEALRPEVPALSGAAVYFSQKGKHRVSRAATWKAQSLTYRAAGHTYRVSSGSFFQVNRFLVDHLASLACHGRSGNLAWDLYAGVGLFSRKLAETFDQVIGVESSPSSSQDLHHNLSGTGHQAVTSQTLTFLRQQVERKEAPPDLILADPPRAGLGKEITSLLTKVRAKQLVYVSCDPATLSRDLRALLEFGYHVQSIHMVDLFPQTFHLESVTVLLLD